MKTNVKAALSIAFCVLTITVAFQNCGGNFKITNLGPIESSSTNGIESTDTADTEFRFSELSLIPSEKANLQVELINGTNIHSITIHSEDGSAKAGDDFEFIQMNLTADEISTNKFSIKINTLYKNISFVDREFTLVFTVFYKNGNPQTLKKTIPIKTIYEKAKYVKLYYGERVMCGLSQANDLYCWGEIGKSGANQFNMAEPQPIKILPADGKLLDMEQFKISGANFCFQQIGSKKVYCKDVLIPNVAERTLKVNEDVPSVADEHEGWELSNGNYLLVIQRSNGDRRIIKLASPAGNAVYSTTSTAGPVFTKIIGSGSGHSHYATDIDDKIYNVHTQSSQAYVTDIRFNIKASDISSIGANNIAILKDGRVGFLPIYPLNSQQPTSVSALVTLDLPEPMTKMVGQKCMESMSGKIYCPKPSAANEYEVVYDLSTSGDRSIGLVSRLGSSPNLNACSLNSNLEFQCRGLLSYTFIAGHNFISSFIDPAPKTKEYIDNTLANGKVVYDLMTASPSASEPPICQNIGGSGQISCDDGKRLPFDHFQMKPETVKGFSNNESFFERQTDLIIGETVDGQWLVSGFANKSFANWFPVYNRKREFQNKKLGGN